ncbi:TRAP transporter small permease [Pannonibacter phragmitetus]|uniref:TRAP transporter small permease protein n=1 Tax=Pannonibacter phragmitetus TaxID=121719 RepID=A0A0U3E835_9HYPH|nr:TRAP transporter small permease [Pannonibacter phragmitetus]ALV27681.1 C4-dicarboxylate ABC transporter permease [Pannonibacter phragmitetus]
MSSVATLIRRIDGIVAGGVATAASLALAIAVASSFWQVLGRFLFHTPASWSEALTRLALVWMVLLGISVALRKGALVAIDLAREATTGGLRRSIEAVTLVSCLIMFATLFWFGIATAQRVQMQEMAGLEISMAWGYAAIPVGSLFAALGAIVHFIQSGKETAQ